MLIALLILIPSVICVVAIILWFRASLRKEQAQAQEWRSAAKAVPLSEIEEIRAFLRDRRAQAILSDDYAREQESQKDL